MTLKLRWLGTSCFQMVLPGDIHIVLDPYMDDSPNSPIDSVEIECCDYIFLTHGHWDHVLDVGKLTTRFMPPVYCNDETASSLVEHQRVDKNILRTLTAGDVVSLPGFKVDVLQGVHTNPSREFKRVFGRAYPTHEEIDDPLERLKAVNRETKGSDQIPVSYPLWRSRYPGGEQLNFVFEGQDGQRIYVAGSYPDPRVRDVSKNARADITLLQCMSADMLKGIEQETAAVAIASSCKTVVPQHYDPIFKGGWQTDLSLLKKILKEQSDMVFLEMVPGNWYAFVNGLEQETERM